MQLNIVNCINFHVVLDRESLMVAKETAQNLQIVKLIMLC